MRSKHDEILSRWTRSPRLGFLCCCRSLFLHLFRKKVTFFCCRTLDAQGNDRRRRQASMTRERENRSDRIRFWKGGDHFHYSSFQYFVRIFPAFNDSFDVLYWGRKTRRLLWTVIKMYICNEFLATKKRRNSDEFMYQFWTLNYFAEGYGCFVLKIPEHISSELSCTFFFRMTLLSTSATVVWSMPVLFWRFYLDVL